MLNGFFNLLKASGWAGPIFLLAGLSLAGCGGDEQAAAPERMKVVVTEARPLKIPRTAPFSGLLAAREAVEVRARASGYLAEKRFEENSIVQQGQVLYKLDDRELKTALDTAQAHTAKAKIFWETEDAARARLVSLADKGAISLRERDAAVATAAGALAAYQAAQAAEEKAEINLGYAAITAPITGLVSRSNVEVGGAVDSDSATLMTTIYNINPILAEFSITDKEYARIKQTIAKNRGRPEAVTFTMLLGDDKVPYQHRGVLETADPDLDSTKTGPISVRASFPNPEHNLRPGLHVNLVGTLGEIDVVAVPEIAIVDQAGSKVVYTVDDQEVVVAAPVVPGQTIGDERIIIEGLNPGQRVIVDGMSGARPGMQVEVVIKDNASGDSGSKK